MAEHRSPKPGVAGSRPVSPASKEAQKKKVDMLSIGKFFGQVKTEMKKVSWPSRDDLTTSTIVVLASTIFLGLFIGVCDLILSRVINFLISGVF